MATAPPPTSTTAAAAATPNAGGPAAPPGGVRRCSCRSNALRFTVSGPSVGNPAAFRRLHQHVAADSEGELNRRLPNGLQQTLSKRRHTGRGETHRHPDPAGRGRRRPASGGRRGAAGRRLPRRGMLHRRGRDRLVSTHHPDLALLDVMLPGRSGFEVSRALRDRADLPIIFLTALDGVRRPAGRVRLGRRRLSGQAVRAGRIARPDPGGAAAIRSAVREPAGDRRPDRRRGRRRGPAGRSTSRTDRDGVSAADLPGPAPGPGTVENPDPDPGLGIRRVRPEPGRGVRFRRCGASSNCTDRG